MHSKAIEKPSSIILPYAWVILAVVYLASVVAPFNQFKVPPIMPVLMGAFQISLTQAGMLMSSLAMIGLVLAIPAGIILQRLGPKITALIALGSLAIGAAIGGLSGSFGMLMAGRVVEGIGMGLIGVAAPATIALWFPPSKQGTPMGIWATWVPVGSVAVYNLSPLLAGSLGWRSIWWVGAAFAVVMIVISALMLRRPPFEEGHPPPNESLDIRKALSNRNIWLLSLSFCCFNLALVSFATYYPTFLSEFHGYNLGQAAFIASIATIMVMISAPLAGVFSDRIGSRRLVFSLPFLAIAVLFVLPFQVTGGMIIAVMVAQGFIAGAIPTATFAAAPEIMGKPQWTGLGLAAILVGQHFGQLIGPILFSQFITSMGWVAAGYLLIPVCLLGFYSGWKVKVR